MQLYTHHTGNLTDCTLEHFPLQLETLKSSQGLHESVYALVICCQDVARVTTITIHTRHVFSEIIPTESELDMKR